MGREMGLDGRMEKSKLEMQFCITMQKIQGTETRCTTRGRAAVDSQRALEPRKYHVSVTYRTSPRARARRLNERDALIKSGNGAVGERV